MRLWMEWLRGLRAKKPAPVTGVPSIRRIKTYSSESGYVYQYLYAGRRGGTEYVFEVSSDRKTYFPVSVFLDVQTLESWRRSHLREVNSADQYAIAKLALFQAFDERANPAQLPSPVHVRLADLELIAERLGFE